MLFTRTALAFFILLITESKVFAEYCDAESEECPDLASAAPDIPPQEKSLGYCNIMADDKCGKPCNSDLECSPGKCWENRDDCHGKGHCNEDSGSSLCGHKCNINTNCGKGQCSAVVKSCPDNHYIGTCNIRSGGSKCGQPCDTDSDCGHGACWKNKDNCAGRGYCNRHSGIYCNQRCNLQADCGSGSCSTYKGTCYSGYCSVSSSSKCGQRCHENNDCSGGLCQLERPTCTSHKKTNIVGTYMGAISGGKRAPKFDSIPKEVNVSFAKDSAHDGNFVAFSGWKEQGITKSNIEKDKMKNSKRIYLVSLGGATSIQSGISTEQWVVNAIHSVTDIIEDLSADGAEMQFEGGTADSQFLVAMTGLIGKLKAKGYIIAIGPYYGKHGGTLKHYKQLSMDNVDLVNLQLYATGTNTVDDVLAMIYAAQKDLGKHASKLVAGFNSNNRLPNPKSVS